MNKKTLKDIAIGLFTGLLLTIFMFAMVTEAKTSNGIMGTDAGAGSFPRIPDILRSAGKHITPTRPAAGCIKRANC